MSGKGRVEGVQRSTLKTHNSKLKTIVHASSPSH
jgi:hypothetical protein